MRPRSANWSRSVVPVARSASATTWLSSVCCPPCCCTSNTSARQADRCDRVEAMLLHDAFIQTAQRLAGKCALVGGERRMHYGQLHRRVLALADVLREDGVAPGDRVLVLLENSIEYAVAVHAVWVAGGVMVPIHPMAKADKVAFIAADTRATALLTHASLAPAWQPALGRSPNILACRVAGALDAVRGDARVRAWPADNASGSMRPAQRGEHDLAALIYTSG